MFKCEVGVGVWMGVGCPCLPICNDIVTPFQLLYKWFVRKFFCKLTHPNGALPLVQWSPQMAIETSKLPTPLQDENTMCLRVVLGFIFLSGNLTDQNKLTVRQTDGPTDGQSLSMSYVSSMDFLKIIFDIVKCFETMPS